MGKSTMARNIAYQALLAGHTVLFANAGQLLGRSGRAGQRLVADPAAAPLRRVRSALQSDEVGYLSYSNRHRRSAVRADQPALRDDAATVITTNKTVLRMARGLPQRRLRRLARRPADPQRRGRRPRGRVLSAQGSRGACPETGRPAPPQQVMKHRRAIKLPRHWTPEQALAAFELVDLIRDESGGSTTRPSRPRSATSASHPTIPVNKRSSATSRSEVRQLPAAAPARPTCVRVEYPRILTVANSAGACRLPAPHR